MSQSSKLQTWRKGILGLQHDRVHDALDLLLLGIELVLSKVTELLKCAGRPSVRPSQGTYPSKYSSEINAGRVTWSMCGLLSKLVLVQPVKSLLDGLLDLLLPHSLMDCGETTVSTHTENSEELEGARQRGHHSSWVSLVAAFELLPELLLRQRVASCHADVAKLKKGLGCKTSGIIRA